MPVYVKDNITGGGMNDYKYYNAPVILNELKGLLDAIHGSIDAAYLWQWIQEVARKQVEISLQGPLVSCNAMDCVHNDDHRCVKKEEIYARKTTCGVYQNAKAKGN